jgi:hypothetical protein
MLLRDRPPAWRYLQVIKAITKETAVLTALSALFIPALLSERWQPPGSQHAHTDAGVARRGIVVNRTFFFGLAGACLQMNKLECVMRTAQSELRFL